ncbi:MAG: hypothetical protein E6614_00185 [Bradyrhizobium sp.]|jgi:hypothetical protein|uniref:Uncharacterized protein n=1 Tax=Bradyrhizobium denitrificans TaxID=2734912 RepID=A0ABS5GJK1_9BRAD|nr:MULTISPECIES: hypothetical protein [Bradyrhizobium]MBR1141500.1 hypothetical protein [Bradyrhizobium denitrificans]MDU0953583.1 hypothetical protein [Bradyrhizobium sp.]MDU1497227.1 hypothetical protein [Bradyrhizobium sp.]MDU1547323.1 hypothetical protein [Bradyrhizobium sp.]MDU1664622.1 hypothetical protein [Bradyrhizobium sp.]
MTDHIETRTIVEGARPYLPTAKAINPSNNYAALSGKRHAEQNRSPGSPFSAPLSNASLADTGSCRRATRSGANFCRQAAVLRSDC